jgi:hypothetical protein
LEVERAEGGEAEEKAERKGRKEKKEGKSKCWQPEGCRYMSKGKTKNANQEIGVPRKT